MSNERIRGEQSRNDYNRENTLNEIKTIYPILTWNSSHDMTGHSSPLKEAP